MLEANALSQPYTYLRNIQTGKSKKLFLSVEELSVWREIPTEAPT